LLGLVGGLAAMGREALEGRTSGQRWKEELKFLQDKERAMDMELRRKMEKEDVLAVWKAEKHSEEESPEEPSQLMLQIRQFLNQ